MLVQIAPPTYALACDAADCTARSPEAHDEATLYTRASAAGWITDAAGDDWCPAHAARAFRSVCVCRESGGETRRGCTRACLEAEARALVPCAVCQRPLGYGVARCYGLTGAEVHVACLRSTEAP